MGAKFSLSSQFSVGVIDELPPIEEYLQVKVDACLKKLPLPLNQVEKRLHPV
jgi:hypothetical protein